MNRNVWESLAAEVLPPGTVSGAWKAAATAERYREHQRLMARLEALCTWCGRFHPLDDTHLTEWCNVENATIRDVGGST